MKKAFKKGKFQDIAGRRRAEETLRKSEAKNSALFSRMMVGFALHRIVTDSDGRAVDYVFLDLNDAFENMTGLAREICIGKRVTEILPGIEKDPADWIGKYGEVALYGREIKFEQYSQPLQKHYAVLAYSPEPGYFATIVEDITERKEMEEALRASEAKFRELANLLPQTIFELDSNLKISFTNKKGFEVFGYTPKDLEEGMSALQVIAPGDRERARENILKVMNGEDLGGIEYEAQRKDGTGFPSIIYVDAVFRENKVVGIRGIVVDITERRKMEKSLLTAEKLAAVGTFVAGAAHELNNPLSCVIGFNQWALSKLERGEIDREGLRDALEKVAGNADRCRTIVSSLLASGRGYGGPPAPVDLHQVIDEAIASAGREIAFDQVAWEKDYSPGVRPVLVNRDDLLKVFINVALNACQAMGGKGILKITTRPAGNRARVIFRDNGAGIRKEDLPRVFDPFFSTKTDDRSAGLGLAVCLGIIRSSEGEITVESEGKGRGATVTIVLPLENRGGYEKESG